jgi:hypothetical protein
MFQSHTLLLPLPILNQPNQNITQKNNHAKSYFKPFLLININPLYVSITHTIIKITNFKPFRTIK